MPFNKYDFITSSYNASGWQTIPKNCNGFTVVNTGTAIVNVNDLIMYPGVPGTTIGDSISFGGNENEIYAGKLKIAFAAVGGEIQVVYKVFVP